MANLPRSTPGSSSILRQRLAEQRMSEEAGDWHVLVQSGAELLPAGCATCIGLGRVNI